MMHRFLCHAAVTCLPGLALSQSRWTVDGQGGGTFTTLQAAFDDPRVLPGDTVFVRDGTYAHATLRKGLFVRGEFDVTIWDQPLVVRDLPAAQIASLYQLKTPQGMQLQNCLGQVLIERCGTQPVGYGWNIEATNCAAVAVVDCRFDWGGDVSCTDSSVALHRCGLRPLIHARRSKLTISDCALNGEVIYHLGRNYQQAPIYLDDSSATISGATLLGDPRFAPLNPATYGRGNSQIVVGTSVAIHVPITDIPVATRDIPAVHLAETRIASTSDGSFTSLASGPYVVVLSLPQPPVFVAALQGDLFVDPARLLLVATGSLNLPGSQPWSLPVPAFGQLSGQTFATQGVQVMASGPVLSNPVHRTMFW